MKKIVKDYGLFLLGLFVASLGVAFSTKAGLGTSPVSSIPYSVSLVSDLLTFGGWLILLSMIQIAVQVLLLRRNCKPVEIVIQIVISFVYGNLTDLSCYLIRGLTVPNYLVRFLYMLLSCVILGFGIWLQFQGGVAMLPGEAMNRAISQVTRRTYENIKIIIDILYILIAAVICLVFLGRLEGVREGSIIAAFLVGTIVRGFNVLFRYISVPKRVRRERKNWAAGDAIRDEGLVEPENLIKYRDIRYSNHRKFGLLDVYVPTGAEYEGKKLPVLINVHGGGYFYGSKELYRFYSMDMACKGFVTVNMNYRLSPEYRFPCALQDIHEVMRWIENHGAEYSMDLDRIFMMGDSAGAQLTSHYAALLTNPSFAKKYSLEPHGLKLRGIGLACGMYDVLSRLEDDYNQVVFRDYLGENYVKGNPMLDVCGAITAQYPPAFVFSCPGDFLYEQCEPFAKLVNERGGRAVSRIYGSREMTEVGHVFHCNMKLPIGAKARQDQAEFFLSL